MQNPVIASCEQFLRLNQNFSLHLPPLFVAMQSELLLSRRQSPGSTQPHMFTTQARDIACELLTLLGGSTTRLHMTRKTPVPTQHTLEPTPIWRSWLCTSAAAIATTTSSPGQSQEFAKLSNQRGSPIEPHQPSQSAFQHPAFNTCILPSHILLNCVIISPPPHPTPPSRRPFLSASQTASHGRPLTAPRCDPN